MDKAMWKGSFFALRYYIIPAQQQGLFDVNDPGQKRASFIRHVLHHQQLFPKRGNPIAITGIREKGSIYFGKLAKRQPSMIHRIREEDIEGSPEDDWPFSYFVCDTRPNIQLLVVQQKAMLSFTPESLTRTLTELLAPKMAIDGYDLLFKPIVDDKQFWQVIREHERIFSVQLELNSPNMPRANETAHRALEGVKNIWNNTSVSFRLSNAHGELDVPKENQLLDALLDYANEGGGEWSV